MGHRKSHEHKCHPPKIKDDKIVFKEPIIAFCRQLRAFSFGHRKSS